MVQKNKRPKARAKRKPTGAVVEAAIRKVMDEVESQLPDKQDIWMQFFEHYVDLTVKEDQTLTMSELDRAANLADYALELTEKRWPTALD